MPSGAEFEDGLTGLHNRHFLDLRMAQMIEQCRHDDIPLHLALIDIDQFESSMSKFPEVTRDAILRGVGWIMRDAFRANDLVARYDEHRFAIALAGVASSEAASVLARLMKMIAGHDWTELKPDLAVNLTSGVVEIGPEDDVPQAIRNAEQALTQPAGKPRRKAKSN